MRMEIKEEKKEAPKFEAFTFTVTVESIGDLAYLWYLTNVSRDSVLECESQARNYPYMEGLLKEYGPSQCLWSSFDELVKRYGIKR